MVYIPCLIIFLFFPCPKLPIPPPQVYFFLRWSHTCFILCFQCIHCARVVPFYSKLFNSVFFNLFFFFFQTEVKCYFLILGWLLKKKKIFQFLFFLWVFWCFKMCCFFKWIQHNTEKLIISSWPANSMCKAFWTRVCIVNLLIWVGVALVIVLIVNCVRAFSKHFYLEVLFGTNVTASLVSVSFS